MIFFFIPEGWDQVANMLQKKAFIFVHFEKLIYECYKSIISHCSVVRQGNEQCMTQGQFLSSLKGLNSVFLLLD